MTYRLELDYTGNEDAFARGIFVLVDYADYHLMSNDAEQALEDKFGSQDIIRDMLVVLMNGDTGRINMLDRDNREDLYERISLIMHGDIEQKYAGLPESHRKCLYAWADDMNCHRYHSGTLYEDRIIRMEYDKDHDNQMRFFWEFPTEEEAVAFKLTYL